MDGEITIGTTLSTDKFDRQVADLERKMQKEEDKKIVLNAKIEVQEEEFERARQKTDELADAYQRLEQLQKTISSGNATPQQFTMAQELQNTYGSLEQIELSFLKALNKQDAINMKTEEMRAKYQQVNDQVTQYKQKIESVKLQKQVSDANRLKDSFNNVGKSIQNSIKSVARLALGVFGVRSAVMGLRRASSYLATYDKQYAANLEYIRYALTQAIAPVLKWIVEMAAKLLGYINAIVQGWFGINLFSKGSAENFNKMKKTTNGVSKAVKEIKKQLSGFDEINMLTDQSDTGTQAGAGGVGTVMPNFDLSKMQGEPPAWLKWIIDNRDLILSILGGILGFIIGIKAGLGGLQALGLGLLIGGIVYAIQQLLEYLKDPTWEHFGGFIQGIGVALIGLGALIGSVPVAVAGAIVLIIGTITRYWEQIKAFFQRGIDWLKGKSDWVHQMFGDVIGNIYDLFTRTLQNLLGVFDSFFKMLKGVFDGIIKFIKGVFAGDWKKAWEGIKDVFKSIWNGIKGIVGGILKIIADMVVTVAKTTGDIIAKAFKAVVNAVMISIETILNTPINAINTLIGVINKLPGVSIPNIPTFNLPRLAVGGIVNMPNKGTLVGGAIAGESGREGVIPLTDSQAMAELGREIGKNVLVNLTNITTMNGRVISRELKNISNEQDFAFNS